MPQMNRLRLLTALLLGSLCTPSATCNLHGERAVAVGEALVMCHAHRGLYMQHADAFLHVVGIRPLHNFSSVQLALFVEGPALSGSHLVGSLDRNRLQFSVQLIIGATPAWQCVLALPAKPKLRVIELVFADCSPPSAASAAKGTAGAWAVKVSWMSGPATHRIYTIPVPMCTEPIYRMVPCDAMDSSSGPSLLIMNSTQKPRPRIGVCLSSISNQRSTLSIRHIVSFLEFYRLSGVHHFVMHLRPDVFIDYSRQLNELYASDAPGFILELIDASYVTRDPFVVTRYPYYDQVPILNSCLDRLAERVDWLGFFDLDEWFVPSALDDPLRITLPMLEGVFGGARRTAFSCLQVMQENVADPYVINGAFADTAYTHYRTYTSPHPNPKMRSSWAKMWCRPRNTRAVWVHHGEGFDEGQPGVGFEPSAETGSILRWDVAVPPANATFRHFRAYLSRRRDGVLNSKAPVSAALNARLRDAVARRLADDRSPITAKKGA